MINKPRKVYWNGAYYDALSKDIEVLKQQAPNLYAVLFPRTEYRVRDEKIQVYQIYYDKHSFENLDAGFIPIKQNHLLIISRTMLYLTFGENETGCKLNTLVCYRGGSTKKHCYQARI